MIGNEEGTGGSSTLNRTPVRPPGKPSRNGYNPPTRRSSPKPIPQNENPSSNPSGHPHSWRKTPLTHLHRRGLPRVLSRSPIGYGFGFDRRNTVTANGASSRQGRRSQVAKRCSSTKPATAEIGRAHV